MVLEIDARGQLNISRPSAFRSLQTGDLPESRDTYLKTAWNREIGVVEDIAHLRADPHAEPLRQVDALDKRQRYGLCPRSDDIAGAGISESPNGVARIGKCGGVNPLVDRLAGVRTDAGHGIGTGDGGAEPTVPTGDVLELVGGHPLHGTVRTPGDKSISHRALLLAALAEGTSTLRGLSDGEDVARTADAVAAIGASVEPMGDGTLVVRARRRDLHPPEGVLDMGNSGTGMRLLAGALAGRPGPLELAQLLDFSRQGCHDDRTMIAVWLTPGSAGEPGPVDTHLAPV